MSRTRICPNFPTFIATFGLIGWLPKIPGTWGSFAAVVIWWFVLLGIGSLASGLVLLGFVILSIWSSDRAEVVLGKDARPIVIDEVVGQWIALLLCPREIGWAALCFFLFRFYDIVKPFPIRISQNLRGGWGIVIDDILAGLYSLATYILIKNILSWLN